MSNRRTHLGVLDTHTVTRYSIISPNSVKIVFSNLKPIQMSENEYEHVAPAGQPSTLFTPSLQFVGYPVVPPSTAQRPNALHSSVWQCGSSLWLAPYMPSYMCSPRCYSKTGSSLLYRSSKWARMRAQNDIEIRKLSNVNSSRMLTSAPRTVSQAAVAMTQTGLQNRGSYTRQW